MRSGPRLSSRAGVGIRVRRAFREDGDRAAKAPLFGCRNRFFCARSTRSGAPGRTRARTSQNARRPTRLRRDARRGAIAIFPGRRVALGSQAPALEDRRGPDRIRGAGGLAESSPIRIVPAAVLRRSARSGALRCCISESRSVEPVALAPGEEPPAGPVRELTAGSSRRWPP